MPRLQSDCDCCLAQAARQARCLRRELARLIVDCAPAFPDGGAGAISGIILYSVFGFTGGPAAEADGSGILKQEWSSNGSSSDSDPASPH